MAGRIAPNLGLIKAHGFTLLELLVVMAIIAAISALVGPAGWRLLAAASTRGAQADVHAVLASMPMSAFATGRTLVLNDATISQQLPALPEGCRVIVPAAIRYSPSGMTQGGVVQLACDGRLTVYQIAEVTGVVKRSDEAPR